MGRPPTRPGKLRDGYYIEVRSKGSKTGIKLRTDTLDEMKQAKLHYEKTKDVIVLGQYLNGKPVNEN